MNREKDNAAWEAMTPEQKRRELYDRQAAPQMYNLVGFYSEISLDKL